jgi:transposase InsO family protein
VKKFKVSERRACKLLSLNRSTLRYRPITPVHEAVIVKRMNELADEHPRWGYRAIAQLLRRDGHKVNDKRVERLWRREGHRVPLKRQKASGKRAGGVAANSVKNQPAKRPHDVWTYDFMSFNVTRGGKCRVLNVLDEFTRLSLGSYVARSIGATAVVAHLEHLFSIFGVPKKIRCDNGREFISATVTEFLNEHGVTVLFVEKASPTQNILIERFNGTMRRNLFDVEEMENLAEARFLVDRFNQEYNIVRPHRTLDKLTPQEFMDLHTTSVK